MVKMSEKEYQQKLDKIKSDNVQKEYRLKLKAEKCKLDKKKSKTETSKLLVVYLFILLNVIVAFAMIAMWHFADLTYLGVLISDIAAQAVIYAIYCLKAYHSKKQEEQVKLEREKMSTGSFDAVNTFTELVDEIEPDI